MKRFSGWVYIYQAHDGRWNIALPTFRTRKEALQYDRIRGYRLIKVAEQRKLAPKRKGTKK